MAWTAPADWTLDEIVTQTKLNTQLRDNMKELWHELAYVEFTANVTATNGVDVEATPKDVVSAGAFTYVANPIVVELFAPWYYFLGVNEGISLWDATTDLGRFIKATGAAGAGAGSFFWRLTPTAASHTYKARIWTGDGSSPTIYAGAGGAGTTKPGYIRIIQKGGA